MGVGSERPQKASSILRSCVLFDEIFEAFYANRSPIGMELDDDIFDVSFREGNA